MRKANVGIIGTGNIGSDLLLKIQRSSYLKCTLFSGIDSNSPNILRAKKMGINTSYKSIAEIIRVPNICDIVFDATSAKTHLGHAPILMKLNKFTIDMTPSRFGKMCIPIINLDECLEYKNINMVSCGAQAIAPVAKAIKDKLPNVNYLELVSSISSYSAGIGTRKNIDEYTQSTSEALMTFSKIKNVKTIIILNPANPPIIMHNTVYIKIKNPDVKTLKKILGLVVNKMRRFVSGYKVVLGPVLRNGVVVIMIQIEGNGDFLPTYAGNLDIINCAAVFAAEEYAKKKLFVKK